MRPACSSFLSLSVLLAACTPAASAPATAPAEVTTVTLDPPPAISSASSSPGAPSAPPGAACKDDGDCRVVSFYCNDCQCVAQAKGAPDPVCTGRKTSCLVDPCGGKKAACDKGSGRCVAR